MQSFWSINKRKIYTWVITGTILIFIGFSILTLFLYITEEDKERFIKEGYFYFPLTITAFEIVFMGIILPYSGWLHFSTSRKLFNKSSIREFIDRFQFQPMLVNAGNKWQYTDEAYVGNINGFEIAMIYFTSKHAQFYLSMNVTPQKLANDKYTPLDKELNLYGAYYDLGKVNIYLTPELKNEDALSKALEKIEPLTKLLLQRGFLPSETKEDYNKLKKIDLRKR